MLVINPVSGDIDKQPVIDMVKQYLGPEIQFSLFETTGEDDINRLRKRLKTFAPDRILVAGGDGTIKMVAQACEGNDYSLGILPVGSANGLATDLNLPKDCKQALLVAMGQKILILDALRIGKSIGLHISDMGLNAELIKNYSESAVRGHFGYFINSIPTLWESEAPYHFSILANGERREVDAIMVAFANSKKFGSGALVNPRGEINDGKFEVLIFKKLSVVDVIGTLNSNIDMDSDFVEVIQTTEVQVTTEKPIVFQIDGEVVGERTMVSVSIVPAYIKVVTDI